MISSIAWIARIRLVERETERLQSASIQPYEVPTSFKDALKMGVGCQWIEMYAPRFYVARVSNEG